jgi:putative cell wall-binding protein
VTHARWILRLRRRVVVLLALAVAAALALASGSGPVHADAITSTSIELRLAELINADRARHGLHPLRVDVRLVASARAWSAQMAGGLGLAHDARLPAGLPGGVTAWAENVGRVAGTDGGDRLHQAFMQSQAHRNHILNPRATELGVGVVLDGSSTWVTERFTAGAPAHVARAVVDAAALAESLFGAGAGHAVVVRDDTYPDALAAGPLAGTGGPLLLSPPGPALHPRVRRALERVLPAGRTVYIVGGGAAVSAEVEHELATAGWRVRRVAGGGRVETAEAVARAVANGGRPATVLLATADDWPDAAAGGAYGAHAGAPVLLTGGGTLHPLTARALADLRPGRIVALGGTAALSDQVVAQAGAIRVAGPTRQGTTAGVAHTLWGRTTATQAPRWILAPADDADAWTWALTAAPLAARANAPVLVAGPGLSADLRDYLRSLGYGGGTSAEVTVYGPVPGAVADEVRALTR